MEDEIKKVSVEEINKAVENLYGGGGGRENTSVVEKNKPWRNWPRRLVDVWKSHDQICLFSYLNSLFTIKEILFETRNKMLQKLEEKIKNEKNENLEGKGIILRGGTSEDWNLYCSDMTKTTFRQEEFFRYIFGVNEIDLWGLVDLKNKKFILFIPPIPTQARCFVGPPKSFEWYMQHFGFDEVYEFSSQKFSQILNEKQMKKVYQLRYENTDSGKTYIPPDVSAFGDMEVDTEVLGPLLAECRSIKTPLEIEYMRACILQSSQGHVYVMRRMHAGMKELHAEALFRSYVCFAGGARHVAYDCICCSGKQGSILHYGHSGRPNDRPIRQNDMLLFDMGGEYNGYASDITVSFPASGRFSVNQRCIYAAVLDAQKSVEKKMKEGVPWTDMHILALSIILTHLIKASILKGSVDECMSAGLGELFMPHGLGHLLGLDTHDVGGFTRKHLRSTDKRTARLRTTRVLEAGMVITVEPGCYFIDYLLDAALKDPKQSRLINEAELAKYRGFGGVRLEDDVVVTKDGIINLTVVPREIEDVEEVLSAREA